MAAPQSTIDLFRLRLVAFQRGYDPGEQRDGKGRFASGGVSHATLGFAWGHPPEVHWDAMTPAQRERTMAAVNPHGSTNECTYCTKMTTGPMRGQRLGFIPAPPRETGIHWNHGSCIDCNRRILIGRLRARGYSAKAARRRANALVRGGESYATDKDISDNPKAFERAIEAEAERMVDLLILHARMAQMYTTDMSSVEALRMRLAEVERRGTPVFGAGHKIIGNVGEDGVFHPAGSATKAHIREALALHEPGSHVHAAISAYLTKSSSSKAPSVADLHATAARLQEEAAARGQPLPAEAKPGQELVKVPGHGEGFKIDAFAGLSIAELHATYGDHQVGAALSRYSTPELREAAKREGIPSNGSKAELVSRITAHVTGGRYSANFPKAASTAKTPAAADPRRAAYARDLAGLRQKHAALLAEHPDLAKAHDALATKAGRTAGAKSAGSAKSVNHARLVAVNIDPRLRVDPYAKLDPYLTHKIYGSLQLRDAMTGYSLAKLKEAVTFVQERNPGTKPTNASSKSSLIDYIVSHVKTGDGQIGPTTQAELDVLRSQRRATTPDITRLRAHLTALITT